MERPLLNDPDVFPDEDLLARILGRAFPAYRAFMDRITGEEYGLSPEWRYYRDGKAWLCKGVYRKKTVFWLSAWDGFFKIAFYFTGKTSGGVYDLEIDQAMKDGFTPDASTGKLKPLILEVSGIKKLEDLLTIVGYKKNT